MVRPANFGSNFETVKDNVFQGKTNLTPRQIQLKAQEEFELYTLKLKAAGVNVHIIQDGKDPKKPDAIFPNNWFSTHKNGHVYLYPMKAHNRRLERENSVLEYLQEHFTVASVVDLTNSEINDLFLEGTGSIIFNHPQKIAYACISQRTDKDLFLDHCHRLGYTPISFNSTDNDAKEIYHTNVMMSVCSNFIIICLETVRDKLEKDQLLNHFNSIKQVVIDISYEQMLNFCCNVLELQNKEGDLLLSMSSRAFNSLTAAQKSIISSTHKIVHSPLETIENIGGGGSRCMMAEVFLEPKK